MSKRRRAAALQITSTAWELATGNWQLATANGDKQNYFRAFRGKDQ
jgi:hypothetical protein